MNIYIKRDELRRAVADAARVVDARTTLPITKHLLFEKGVDNAHIIVTGTDLNTWVERKAQAVIHSEEGEAAFTVEAAFMEKLLARLPDGEISIERKNGDNKAFLACGDTTCSLLGLPAEEFHASPTHTKRQQWASFDMEARELTRMVRGVSFAAAEKEAPEFRQCVAFDATPDSLRVLATDTKSLAFCDAQIKGVETGGEVVAVTAAALNKVLPMCESQEVVTLYAGQDFLQLVAPNVFTITLALMKVTYPDYRRVLPSEYLLEQTFDRQGLLAMIERAALYAKTDTHEIELRVFDDTLEVEAENSTIGRFSESLATVARDAPGSYPPHSMYLNASRVTSILRVIENRNVRLGWNGEFERGLTFRPGDNDNHLCFLAKMTAPVVEGEIK